MSNGIKWFIPPSEKLVLRSSLIKTFLNCPAKALFRYFKGLVVPPSSALTFGRCFHKTTEFHNKRKKRRGKNTKLSTLQDVFHEEFKMERKKTQWLQKENPSKLEKLGTDRIVPLYYKKSAKRCEPKYVEESFRIKLEEFNTEITGTIDLVNIHDRITDYKTKGRRPSWDEAKKSMQGKIYRLGYKHKFKKPARGFDLEFYLKKKYTEMIPLKEDQLSEKDERYLIAWIGKIVGQIRIGAFYPREEGNYLCSKHWCGYWSICKGGAWKNPIMTKVFNKNEFEED